MISCPHISVDEKSPSYICSCPKPSFHGTLLHFEPWNLILKWDFQDSNIFNRSTRGWSLAKGFLLTGFIHPTTSRSLQVQTWWIWSLISHAFMAMAPWLPELNPQDVSKRVTNVETWEAEGWRWRCDTTKTEGIKRWLYFESIVASRC